MFLKLFWVIHWAEVWVLSSVFSNFCITSFGVRTGPQHQYTTLSYKVTTIHFLSSPFPSFYFFFISTSLVKTIFLSFLGRTERESVVSFLKSLNTRLIFIFITWYIYNLCTFLNMHHGGMFLTTFNDQYF